MVDQGDIFYINFSLLSILRYICIQTLKWMIEYGVLPSVDTLDTFQIDSQQLKLQVFATDL